MTTEKDDKWFQQLQLYMQGKLGEDETRDLQRKVMVSEDLSNKLESLLFTDLLSSPGESDGDRSLSVEQQQRIMRKSKWRSRFSQLFFTTGGIAACIAILLIVSQVANYVWFWPAAKHIQRVLDDVVSFTQPALRVGSGGTNGGLLFSMDMKYTLEEQLGREDKLAGYVKNSVSPLQSHLSFQWNNGYRRNLLFFHYPYPGQPQQNANGIHVFDQAWRTLDRLPEGTVSQLAVSFDHLMTPEEVVALLKNADVEITWLALATGQEEAEGEQAVLGKGAVWGYNPKAHELGTKGAVHTQGGGARQAEAVIQEMEYLISQKKWAEPMLEEIFIGSEPKLEERVAYLKKNGVRLYGAVLTGPTKELLTLKERRQITNAYVGQIGWWNWEQPASSGIEYSWD